jgi:hypothetical protein
MAYTQTDPSSIEAAIIAFGKGERAGLGLTRGC